MLTIHLLGLRTALSILSNPQSSQPTYLHPSNPRTGGVASEGSHSSQAPTSCTSRGVEGQHRLDRHIHGWDIERLEHDLQSNPKNSISDAVNLPAGKCRCWLFWREEKDL